jgi:CheY-like chemotaxis protein
VRILLVDPEGERAAALGEALTAAGARITLATSGSFALTMLEWNRHDVIVSRTDLGDMRGDELCTILRDDPGMKELRFALIAWPDEVSPGTGAAGIDVILPTTMSAPAMLVQITRLMPDVAPLPVEPPAATDTAAADTADDTDAAGEAEESQGFAGSLDGIELGELARAIAEAGRTGHLLVGLAMGGGAVAFEGGRVVHAEFGDETGGAAFAALLDAAQRERAGDFCFVADDSGDLRGTPRTVHARIEDLLGEGSA